MSQVPLELTGEGIWVAVGDTTPHGIGGGAERIAQVYRRADRRARLVELFHVSARQALADGRAAKIDDEGIYVANLGMCLQKVIKLGYGRKYRGLAGGWSATDQGQSTEESNRRTPSSPPPRLRDFP